MNVPDHEMFAARVAYKAYCAYTGNKSLITGDELPKWDKLPAAIHNTWHAAAKAAADVYRDAALNNCRIFRIVVNGKKLEFYDKTMSYYHIVYIAGKDKGIYTVTYSAPGKDGTMLPGQVVDVVDGMIFNVTQMGNMTKS